MKQSIAKTQRRSRPS